MNKRRFVLALVFIAATAFLSPSIAQEKKLEKIRVGGGKVAAKARAAKAGDFIDSRLIRELDESGFLNRL